MLRRVTALAFVALAGVGCGRAENSLLLLDQLPDVQEIRIEGNERVSDGTLKALMTLREGTWWNPFRDHKYRKAQLKTDASAILTYYLRHGYLRAQVQDQQVLESKGKVIITLTVEEGLPYTVRGVSIHGLSDAEATELAKKLTLETGQPMDPFRLQEGRRILLDLLADRGHWEATVDASVHYFGQDAFVFYRVGPGAPVVLEDLTISGQNRLEDRVIRREISTEPGTVLERRQLEKSQTRLLQSGLFADARWDTSGLDTLGHQIDVDFRVRERRLHWWELGIGISSEGQLRASGEWGSRSFLGTGARFAANTRTDFDLADRLPGLIDEHRTELILNIRHLFGTNWEGQPNVFYRYDQEIVVDTRAVYSQDFLGAGFNSRLRFGDLRNQVVVAIQQQWVWNEPDSLARANDIQLARDTYVQRTLSGFVERDSRNAFFNPTRGSFHDATLQIAGGALGGQSNFLKGAGGTVRFLELPIRSAVLGGRLRGGYIWPPGEGSNPDISLVERVPTQDRFTLGGANTVRGYEQNELNGLDPARDPDDDGASGGLAQVLVNLEVRIPLFWRLGGVGFMDVGNVWQTPDQLRWENLVPHGKPENVEPEDVRYTYGLGLRLGTPVGPVRVDYAWKWNQPPGDTGRRSGWHVAIGQAF